MVQNKEANIEHKQFFYNDVPIEINVQVCKRNIDIWHEFLLSISYEKDAMYLRFALRIVQIALPY